MKLEYKNSSCLKTYLWYNVWHELQLDVILSIFGKYGSEWTVLDKSS